MGASDMKTKKLVSFGGILDTWSTMVYIFGETQSSQHNYSQQTK